jgi:hypothetical protein
MSLQQMFNNAQEVVDNIQACKELQNQILDEKLKDEEPETVHNMQEADRVISFLEGFHEDVFAKNDDKLEEQDTLLNFFDIDLNLDPFHHELETDCFMYTFVDGHECEFVDQLAEEKDTT